MIDIKQLRQKLINEYSFDPSPIQNDLITVLDQKGPQTRSELVKAVDAPRTTVYDNLTRLQNINIIKKFSRPQNFRGRPLVFFKLFINQ